MVFGPRAIKRSVVVHDGYRLYVFMFVVGKKEGTLAAQNLSTYLRARIKREISNFTHAPYSLRTRPMHRKLRRVIDIKKFTISIPKKSNKSDENWLIEGTV